MEAVAITDLGKYEAARPIIDRYVAGEKSLMGMLLDIQDEFNFLPEAVLLAVAEETGIPLAHLYGLATFYDGFSLKARGRNHIECCTGTACVVRGARTILTELVTELGISPGGLTDDSAFSLETVHCFGACAHGPILVAGGEYYGYVTQAKAREIVEKLRKSQKEARK